MDNIIDKIDYYSGKVIYFGLIAIGLFGLFVQIKSDGSLSGGPLGILFTGFATIGQALHLSARIGNYILGGFLCFIFLLFLRRFFSYPNRLIRILVYFIAILFVFYVLSMVFGWTINV